MPSAVWFKQNCRGGVCVCVCVWGWVLAPSPAARECFLIWNVGVRMAPPCSLGLQESPPCMVIVSEVGLTVPAVLGEEADP
jgi:hypothetical protein